MTSASLVCTRTSSLVNTHTEFERSIDRETGGLVRNGMIPDYRRPVYPHQNRLARTYLPRLLVSLRDNRAHPSTWARPFTGHAKQPGIVTYRDHHACAVGAPTNSHPIWKLLTAESYLASISTSVCRLGRAMSIFSLERETNHARCVKSSASRSKPSACKQRVPRLPSQSQLDDAER